MITDMLATEGHEVITASNGAEGLAHFLNNPSIDFVLTDLGMPGMTGWELARTVKAARPSLAVGIITGWGEVPGDAERRASVDFVLSKPITADDLRSALASVRLPREAPSL